VDSPIIEVRYPLKFRQEDARVLGEHIRLRHNVDLVGVKRVGIGDFLNFFLYHKDIVKKYIEKERQHLLIPVDLNDLVETELFAFWILTLKRVVDFLEKTAIEPKIKKHINSLFLSAIQSQDLFLTIESLREVLNQAVKNNFLPTIFFLRFDRIANLATADFFANLQGLRESTGQKLCLIFTSFRSISRLSPQAFEEKLLSLFSHVMYLKPANEKDSKIILRQISKKYRIRTSGKTARSLIKISGGHAQYLYLSLIIFNQLSREMKITIDNLVSLILQDERISLQSEEIWESLTDVEKKIIVDVAGGKKITPNDRKEAKYLWETGLVVDQGGLSVFSPLLASYMRENGREKQKESVELTRKENLLFSLLFENLGNLCEREKIVEVVWGEYEDLGVSDWTIDRLVARLRNKLNDQKSQFELLTVKTRGFKLVKAKYQQEG